jgi:hypothetical protein
MECKKEVWNSEGSLLSREALMVIKEADRIAEMNDNRPKYPNPTNEKLSSLGLTKDRKKGK